MKSQMLAALLSAILIMMSGAAVHADGDAVVGDGNCGATWSGAGIATASLQKQSE